MNTCALECCEKYVYARGLCKKHYTRLRKHGDPNVVLRGGGHRGSGPAHPSWKGRAVSYRSAHMRVQHLRGKASQHQCECGKQAQDWAYDYTDPEQLSGSNGRREMVYSPDVERYQPMCRSCHRYFDKERDGEPGRLRSVSQ